MSSPFDEIKSRLAAETVLAEFLGPSRHHTWHCPFHEDRTPSLSAHGPAIRCFGCQWAGDIFRFLEDYHGIGRGESLQLAADLAGVILPERILQDGNRGHRRLPSPARNHAHILREIATLERDIFSQAQQAAAQAWRTTWDVKGTAKVWDAVAIAAALDREIALLEMASLCEEAT